MSDYDEDMGEEEYEFEYSEGEDPPEADVDVENEYYNAKNEVESSAEAAIKGFRKVLEMQEEEGKWVVLSPGQNKKGETACTSVL